jgi:VanZ family protein
VHRQTRNFAVLSAIMAAVIVYGSLYPFEFYDHKAAGGPVVALLGTWRRLSSRGDIISNLLLYLPLGFFLALWLDRLPVAPRILLVAVGGLSLSVSIELTQFYDASRETAMSDVYTNTAGALLGAIAAVIIGSEFRVPFAGGLEPRPFVVLLVVCWCGYRLFPYVPTIDLHKYWDALKPLVFAPKLPALALYRHIATWLTLAVLLEALFGSDRRRWIFFLFVPAILFARIFIVDAILSPAEVLGGLIAVLAWIGGLAGLPARAGVVASLFALLIVLIGLEPFQFQSPPRAFGWIPFLSFMRGGIEVNIQPFFEKVFTYGAMLWLLGRAGWPLGASTVSVAALVLALRYAEIYLPGRSAEITDFVIVLMIATVIKLVPEEVLRSAEKQALTARVRG